MSGGALETVYMRTLLSADKSPSAPHRGCKQHQFPTSKSAPNGSCVALYARLGISSRQDLTNLHRANWLLSALENIFLQPAHGAGETVGYRLTNEKRRDADGSRAAGGDRHWCSKWHRAGDDARTARRRDRCCRGGQGSVLARGAEGGHSRQGGCAAYHSRRSKRSCLVNNAGIGQGSIRADQRRNPLRFWEITPEQWNRFVAVNATAPLMMARAVIPHMLRASRGRIVTVTTSLGTMLREGYILYGASKAAAEAATAVMSADLAGTGVTANVLVPGGMTDTRIVPDAAVADRSRLLRPEIMAPPLLWLVSDAAAGVTGRRFLAAHWDTDCRRHRQRRSAAPPSLGRASRQCRSSPTKEWLR